MKTVTYTTAATLQLRKLPAAIRERLLASSPDMPMSAPGT